MQLLEINHPAIDISLSYATAHNITGLPLDKDAQALLHPDAHEAKRRCFSDLYRTRTTTPQTEGLGRCVTR